MIFSTFILAICLISVVYVYVGYPFATWIVSRLFAHPTVKKPERPAVPPTISVIVAARNEERDIRRKLENTLELDYPSESIEIIVVSDGSTDRTSQIVGDFEPRNVRLIRQFPRAGKTAAQNLGASESNGEILLFSDATTMCDSKILQFIVRNFSDPAVGCVAGRLLYYDPLNSRVGSGARNYWSYESSLKRIESAATSLIGVSGCLYAVRRSVYRPMYPEACSDFLIASQLYRQGLRTVYEPDAVCFEETNFDGGRELTMRTRIVAQTLGDLWRNSDMLNPFRYGFFAIQLISHKFLRYMAPFFFLGLISSTAYLSLTDNLFLVFFVLQLLFVVTALLGFLLERFEIRSRLFSVPFYFALTNVASVAGIYKFLRGERFATWEPARTDGQMR